LENNFINVTRRAGMAYQNITRIVLLLIIEHIKAH
jgi:hypothetical protein